MAADRIIAVPEEMRKGRLEALSSEPIPRRRKRARRARPSWACWNGGIEQRYTVGVEEELMLLHLADASLAPVSDAVLAQLSPALASHTSPETHAAVLELATEINADASGALAEVAALRGRLAGELRPLGLAAASAGTYPLRSPGETPLSASPRYRMVAGSMRVLARRDPTLALHVHIGVPDAEDAIRVLNGLRGAVPVLLALAANSPFCQGRDTGLASARTVIFQGFPRTGTARAFDGYDDYVAAVDALIESGALPDPSFLWWDLRLQPSLGTVEVRVMDAQSTVADDAALIALVQSLARLELEGEPTDCHVGPEVLAENRFLAARDGLDARLIDPVKRELVPVRRLVDKLVSRCEPHAAALGCSALLERVGTLAAHNGANRQRARAAESTLDELAFALSEQFAPPRPPLARVGREVRLAEERSC